MKRVQQSRHGDLRPENPWFGFQLCDLASPFQHKRLGEARHSQRQKVLELFHFPLRDHL